MLPNPMIAGVNSIETIALFLALIVSAVSWNFATWWLGIPNSTTHTYIGSIIGVSMAYAFINGRPVGEAINWHQGRSILVTLIVSPIVGFILGFVLLKLIGLFVKDPAMYRPAIHHKRHPEWDTWDRDPDVASPPETVPPAAIRAGLIAGSAGVAFLHGSNDGQKSIGLMMLVLFALAPLSYGLNSNRLNEADIRKATAVLQQVETIAGQYVSDPVIGAGSQRVLEETRHLLVLVGTRECADAKNQQSAACATMRAGLLDLHQTIARSLKHWASSSSPCRSG